jgi:hypothetical protein
MVPGGLEVISYVIRLIPATSLVILDEIFRRMAGGKWNQSCENKRRGRRQSSKSQVKQTHRCTNGSHEVVGGDSSESNDLVVRPLVTGNTDSFDGKESGERLRDLVVQAGSSDLLDVDGVGLLEEGDLVARDGSEDSDGESRSGEGVSANEVLGDVEQSSEVSDLICRSQQKQTVSLKYSSDIRERRRTLEELSQRLDELELHVGKKSPNVMVGLDGSRGTLEAERLDDVGEEGSLEEPLDLALLARVASLLEALLELGGLGLEDLDEGVSDDLSLLLGVLDVLESREEEVRGVDDGQVDTEVLVEHLEDLLGLAASKNSVVDHDGVESEVKGEAEISFWHHQRRGSTSRRRTHRSPIASCISFAATVESTPPETAPMTCPLSPQMLRILWISFSMKVSCKNSQESSRTVSESVFLQRAGVLGDGLTMVQSCLAPQMSTTKFLMTSLPLAEWVTSAWN